MRRIFFVAGLLLCGVGVAGDQTPEPQAAGPVSASGLPGLEIDVRHGEPRPFVDGVGWMIGLPNKLLLLDSRADNHNISPATVSETTDFLSAHDVDGVMVRVNQYDPIGEWRRLADNDRIALPWRATVGALYTLGYSVLPGRLVGGDWYNPFTDTVHVYSDVPALAMEQAAQAYDSHEKTHPGFYSAVRLMPLVGIVHEARAKQVVFEHIDETGTVEEQAEARRVLHPQMGREVGGQAALFVPQADALLSLGGVAVGHVVGRYQANQIEETNPPATPAPAPTIEPPLTEPFADSPFVTPAPGTAIPGPLLPGSPRP